MAVRDNAKPLYDTLYRKIRWLVTEGLHVSDTFSQTMSKNVPTAIMSSFLGRTIFTTRSVYLNIASIISSSVEGGGRSSG